MSYISSKCVSYKSSNSLKYPVIVRGSCHYLQRGAHITPIINNILTPEQQQEPGPGQEQKLSHTHGAGGLAWGGNSYPETRRGRFLDHLRRRVDFNATVDHERDLVLVCCLLLLLWLSTAWLWLWLPVVSGLDHLHIMDMDPV